MKNAFHDFASNPVSVNIQRSTFDRSSRVKTSFNAGSLVPFTWMRSFRAIPLRWTLPLLFAWSSILSRDG